MATNSIRHLVKQQLVALIDADPNAPAQVAASYVGDAQDQDSIWIGNVTNVDVEIPLMQGGRKQRDDTFNVDVIVQSLRHGNNVAESDAQAAGYLKAVENVLANDPSLGSMDGVIDAQITAYDGPKNWFTAEGVSTFYEVTVTVHARYQ